MCRCFLAGLAGESLNAVLVAADIRHQRWQIPPQISVAGAIDFDESAEVCHWALETDHAGAL